MKTEKVSGRVQSSFKKFLSSIVPCDQFREWLWSVRHNIKVQETAIGGREIRIITPFYKKSEDVVLYLYGRRSSGNSPGKLRKQIYRIMKETGVTVFIPDLWSAPVLTQGEAIDFLGDLYCNFLMGLKNRRIIFYGDSTGRELAEEFTQKLRNERVCPPYKIIQPKALPQGGSPKPGIFDKLPDAVLQS